MFECTVQTAEKSEEDDNFCISCGKELRLHKNRENLQDIGMKSNPGYENKLPKDNVEYSYPEKHDNNEIQLAGLESRIGAYLIDMLVIFAVVMLTLTIMADVQAAYASDGSMDFFFYLLILIVFYGYFILLEGPLGKGRTVGKRALKLRVVKKEDHGKIGYGKSFGRNILRIIDGIFFYYRNDCYT